GTDFEWTLQQSNVDDDTLFAVSFGDYSDGWAVGKYGKATYTTNGFTWGPADTLGEYTEVNFLSTSWEDEYIGWLAGSQHTLLHTTSPPPPLLLHPPSGLHPLEPPAPRASAFTPTSASPPPLLPHPSAPKPTSPSSTLFSLSSPPPSPPSPPSPPPSPSPSFPPPTTLPPPLLLPRPRHLRTRHPLFHYHLPLQTVAQSTKLCR
ncbi:hypothetical protein CYMTET_33844, partial [Cymbomonas tetramitiformis]